MMPPTSCPKLAQSSLVLVPSSFSLCIRERMLEANGLSSDQLQESFINTSSAWVNMLQLSSCGPIKTQVAACATAAVSVGAGGGLAE
jgi:3-oxoacyl-(acyl-carrier-protein) synthase